MLSPGSVVSVIIDYRAVRDDEVNVSRGEQVTVISSNITRGYLVYRPGHTRVTPPAEGWIPAYCLHLQAEF